MEDGDRDNIRHASFEIRKAEVTDAADVAGCLRVAFGQHCNEYTPEAYADTVLDADGVRHRLCKMRLFVAVTEGKVVGTIGCLAKGEEGHLRGMAVTPNWQGTGVAPALLRVAEAELRENGCRYVTLDTTAPLVRAVRFYLNNGYSRSGRVADFFGMPLYEYRKLLL